MLPGGCKGQKFSTPSIGCLRARARMPGAVATTTAHLATIRDRELSASRNSSEHTYGANMGGHGMPGREHRNGIRAVIPSSVGTANSAGIANNAGRANNAGIMQRDHDDQRDWRAPIRPIPGEAGVTTDDVTDIRSPVSYSSAITRRTSATGFPAIPHQRPVAKYPHVPPASSLAAR